MENLHMETDDALVTTAPASNPPEAGELAPMFCIFDTETTGLFDFKLPADDPSQPRLASVGFILADQNGNEIERVKAYVRPDGWEMGEGAGAVNGLTTAFLHENGVSVSSVLDRYQTYVDLGLIVVAFNAQFDCKVMRSELRRAGRDDLFLKTRNICVMRGLASYKDEGLPIRGGFVKLSAACEFFKIVNKDAHDAMADAEAALGLLQRLISDDRLPEAKVHLAKAKD